MIDLRQIWNSWATRPSSKEKAWKEKATHVLAMLTSSDGTLDLSSSEQTDFSLSQLMLARFILRIGGTSVFDNEKPACVLKDCILRILERRCQQGWDDESLGNLPRAVERLQDLLDEN